MRTVPPLIKIRLRRHVISSYVFQPTPAATVLLTPFTHKFSLIQFSSQPTPEVYSLFDDVIMMREGSIVYHGPRDAIPGYMASLGFEPPHAHPALPAPDGAGGVPLAREVSAGTAAAAAPAVVDMADYLTEFLTHPHKVYRRQVRMCACWECNRISSAVFRFVARADDYSRPTTYDIEC